MITLCTYDLVYLIASLLMFSIPLLYPGIVVNVQFTFSVPFLLPIAQTAMTGAKYLSIFLSNFVLFCNIGSNKNDKTK